MWFQTLCRLIPVMVGLMLWRTMGARTEGPRCLYCVISLVIQSSWCTGRLFMNRIKTNLFTATCNTILHYIELCWHTEAETKQLPFRRWQFQCIFLNENARISIQISLKFVPKVSIDNIPALLQIMVWRRSGDKPLSEPMMVSQLLCLNKLNKGSYTKADPQFYTPRHILLQNVCADGLSHLLTSASGMRISHIMISSHYSCW